MSPAAVTLAICVLLFLLATRALLDETSLWVLPSAIIYFAPSLIHLFRAPWGTFAGYAAVNLLLGWTGVGWLVLTALASLSGEAQVLAGSPDVLRSRSAAIVLWASRGVFTMVSVAAFVLGVGWFAGEPAIRALPMLHVYSALCFYLWPLALTGTIHFWRSLRPHPQSLPR